MQRRSGFAGARRGLGHHLILLGGAGADAHAADDFTVDGYRQATTDDAEMSAIGDMDAKGRLAGHAQLVVDMRAAPCHRAGEGLVDGNRDARHLAAIHSVKADQVSGFIGDGDAHRHADLV